MKKNRIILCLLMLLSATNFAQDISNPNYKYIDTIDATNNFYDNVESYRLVANGIEVAGEVENPSYVDFAKLKKHSVIVKETLLNGDKDKFVGAYRYDGYSLFDILNTFKLKKKNADIFHPIIDVYLEIENSKGEKVVVSWGEVYYPNYHHDMIIATDVARIVPSKTKDLWPLPTESKLVITHDLITERNISSPVKITVKTFPLDIKVVKDLKPNYSAVINLFKNNKIVGKITENPKEFQNETLHTIFYGRGKGIHSTDAFTGIQLKKLIGNYSKQNQSNLRNALVVIAAVDGYRAVYTYSELMNRNDQQEVLLLNDETSKENGKFKVFPSCDFFSDRAVKGINSIYIVAE
ncbi:MAG: hypothetical protein ACOYO1_17240 [Bacteroidales bacterium]